MSNIKVAVYCRVSTTEQELQQQVDSCKKYCEMKGWDYEVFTEVKSSTKERPVFDSVLAQCRINKFSVLMVFRLDRAWRSSRQFIMDFDSLVARGVYTICVMEGLDTTTPLGKAMATILVALAELERVNISIATKQRLQALKSLGRTLGRPKGKKDDPQKTRQKSGYYGNVNASKKRGLKNRAKV